MSARLSPPCPPPTLSPDEAKLLAAYRSMDVRRKVENLSLMEVEASLYPANPRVLHLIKRGAQ